MADLLDLNQLKQILDLVREHDLSEFEVEHEGLRLKIRKDSRVPAVSVAPSPADVPGGLLASAAQPAAGIGGDDTGEMQLAVVKSPIVGTFFRSPEPGAPSFVEVGTTIKKGQVLCIIEAMKLMNEINSEYNGQVVSIYVESGQPVQYGERLMAIRTE